MQKTTKQKIQYTVYHDELFLYLHQSPKVHPMNENTSLHYNVVPMKLVFF